jgi:hypothetical protein
MPTIAKTTTTLNKIYEENKVYFQEGHPSFHNLLWQLIFNEVHADKLLCFTTVTVKKYKEAKWQIGIVFWNEYGYTPTSVFFSLDTDYDVAESICERLNLDIFGLTPQLAYAIVDRSMALQKDRNGDKTTDDSDIPNS